MKLFLKLFLLFSIITSTCVFSMEERGKATLDHIIEQFCKDIKSKDSDVVLRVRSMFDQEELDNLDRDMGEYSDRGIDDFVESFGEYLALNKLQEVLDDACSTKDLKILYKVVELLLENDSDLNELASLAVRNNNSVVNTVPEDWQQTLADMTKIYLLNTVSLSKKVAILAYAVSKGLKTSFDLYELIPQSDSKLRKFFSLVSPQQISDAIERELDKMKANQVAMARFNRLTNLDYAYEQAGIFEDRARSKG
jgi:hypothetical protein